jgi:hypothetical protein
MLWEWWTEAWEVVRSRYRRGDQVWTVHLGDAVDGDHHDTAQIITRNRSMMVKHALEVLTPVREFSDEYFQLRGTESHVGGSGELEETLARELRATPADANTDSWWKLALEADGVNFHFAHHGKLSTAEGARNGSLDRQAFQEWVKAKRLNRNAPDFIVRGDRHLFAEGRYDNLQMIQAPSWQLETAFVNRVAPSINDIADFGLLLFIVDNGHCTWEWIGRNKFVPAAPKVWSKKAS